MTLISYYNYLILNLYKNFKDNNIELDYYKLAKIYEYYTCIKLEEEYDELFYEYDIIPPEFKETHNLSKYDSGIDCCNLVDSIVQCKLRKKSLNWGECSTFFASQNSYCSSRKETIIKWNKLIISRNDNIKLSKNLEIKKNMFIDKLYNINEVIEYCDNLYNNVKINKHLKSNKDIKLRDYQIEAINIIKQSNKNVIISLPTGTGKNIVIINSLEYGKKYLILVPRIILMDQLKDIIIQYYPHYKSIIQCIGSKSNMFNDDKLITISVYNSINHIEPYKYDFDKIFIDEAHHIYTPEIYQSDNYNEDYKELTYIDKIRSLYKLNNVVYLSATIDPNKNHIYYKKDIRDMIELKYLTDYIIKIPIFKEDIDNINIANYLIVNYRNIIIYCNTKKEGEHFNSVLNKLLPNSSAFIDCDTTKTQRNIILNNYNNNNISFLVNVQVLIEGFDSPITKGVVFLHLPSSKNTIIQIIGRSLRLHSDKKYANVILPYSTNDDGNTINNFLQILADNDSRIKKSFMNKNTNGYISLSNKYEDNDNEYNDIKNFDDLYQYDLIYNKMGIQLNKYDIWYEKLNKVKKYIDENNKRPSYSDSNTIIRCMAEWIGHNLRKYKFKIQIMLNEKIKNEWEMFIKEYNKYFKSNTEVWYENLNKLKIFINTNNKKPNVKNENIEIKQLGEWVLTNHKNYKDKINIMKDNEIYNEWSVFLNKYKQIMASSEEKWYNNLKDVKKYIDENNKKPLTKDNNKEISKLGSWISTNILNYKNQTYNMKIDKIKNDWEIFINEYNNYFKTDIEIWYCNLDKVKKYIDENNKRPNKRDIDKNIKFLGRWIDNNLKSYKNMVGVMKSENIRFEWDKFIYNYKDKY